MMTKYRENLKFMNGNLTGFSSLELFAALKALPSSFSVKWGSTLNKLAVCRL